MSQPNRVDIWLICGKACGVKIIDILILMPSLKNHIIDFVPMYFIYSSVVKVIVIIYREIFLNFR
jgi:hypothetical protein